MKRLHLLAAVSAFSFVYVPLMRSAEAHKEFTPMQRRWWAIQKVVKPPVPAPKDAAWVRNPIDAFILEKLEAKDLKPAPPADKITLLRRATLDLTGLVPTPEETQAFLSDDSPNAYEKVVDRLLASLRYGERWARHWLDLARYADSEGFKSDETRPNIWRYRDYVIRSFNEDKPYDRFMKEQIAGDELYPRDPDALIATGFNRHFPDESNARNLMQRRQELLNDITDTVSATFLGLTYGCAHGVRGGACRLGSQDERHPRRDGSDGQALPGGHVQGEFRQVPGGDSRRHHHGAGEAHSHPVADVLQGQATAPAQRGRGSQKDERRGSAALEGAGGGAGEV